MDSGLGLGLGLGLGFTVTRSHNTYLRIHISLSAYDCYESKPSSPSVSFRLLTTILKQARVC